MTKKTKSKPKASSKPVDQSFALAEELLRMASVIDDYTDLPGQTISESMRSKRWSERECRLRFSTPWRAAFGPGAR